MKKPLKCVLSVCTDSETAIVRKVIYKNKDGWRIPQPSFGNELFSARRFPLFRPATPHCISDPFPAFGSEVPFLPFAFLRCCSCGSARMLYGTAIQ